MNLEYILRKVFTPGFGSYVRNVARSVLPLLQLFGVVHLTTDQIAQIMLALEAVFATGGSISKRV